MDTPHATPDPAVRTNVPRSGTARHPHQAGRRDIRHLVCRLADGSDRDYLAARRRVLADIAAGLDSRIVLLTARTSDTGGLPFDIPVDIIPALAPEDAVDGGAYQFIFTSVRPGTVFLISDNGHPGLARIRRDMRALTISFVEYKPEAG